MVITLNEVKTYKGLEDADDDALLTVLIEATQDWFNRECKRTVFAETDTTRYIDAIGEHLDGLDMYVSQIGDLCAITSITNGDGVAVSTNEYTTYPKVLTVEEPVFNRIRLLPSSNKYWTYTTDYENAISITGKWGLFATAPASLKQMLKRLTLYAYKVKDTDAFETIVIPDAGMIQAPTGFPVDVARMVRLLRRP